jgi:hypothetical protein
MGLPNCRSLRHYKYIRKLLDSLREAAFAHDHTRAHVFLLVTMVLTALSMSHTACQALQTTGHAWRAEAFLG